MELRQENIRGNASSLLRGQEISDFQPLIRQILALSRALGKVMRTGDDNGAEALLARMNAAATQVIVFASLPALRAELTQNAKNSARLTGIIVYNYP